MTERSLRLGKKTGVVHDPRTLRLLDYLATMPSVPTSWELAKGVESPVFGNDRYGDCTCAAQGHRIVMEDAHAGTKPLTGLRTKDVLAVYSAVTGFRADSPLTDNGAYLIDVLRYMRSTGMGGHKIGAYVKVDHTNHTQVKAAAWMFDGLYIGANMPLDAEKQFNADQVWTPTSGPGGEPGGWGGHCVEFDGYSAARGGCRTWGYRQRFTWAWFDKYVDEVWAIVSPDQLSYDGKTPEGFDNKALQLAIAAL